MSCTSRKIDQLRLQIPSFACVPGCHDCCGPVTASSEEMSRLPVKSDAEHMPRWPSTTVCILVRKGARCMSSVR